MLKKLFFLGLILFPQLIFGQRHTISGYLEAANSGERLAGAVVYDKNTKANVITNAFGFYSLTLPDGAVDLVASLVGYAPASASFSLKSDTLLTFLLKNNADLETVEINAARQDRLENRIQMSQITLPIEQIKKMPALLGETDILKTLQLLPGVKFGSEGTSGLFVRGGSNDQNLILLDGVPVYNASHIGGLFSVFNADAIKDVKITTGGFPARYGGRLSSVVEINMKEGNLKKWQADGGIGIISSRLTLEGPLLKDKVSCMISARRTYADLLIKPFRKAQDPTLESYALHFYDINAKINWKISEKHRLYLSAYTGQDKFGEGYRQNNNASFVGYSWGNLTSALRWNWRANSKVFVNTSLTRTTFGFNFQERDEFGKPVKSNELQYRSSVADWGARSEIDYYLNKNHHFKVGIASVQHVFKPNKYVYKSNSRLDTSYGNADLRSLDHQFFVEDEWTFKNGAINVGIHRAWLQVSATTYSSTQPRLGVLYQLPDAQSLKASFATMTQFIHLLTNDGGGFPTDLWVSTTERIKPQNAWQAAVGYTKMFKETYQLSMEVYYKRMKNVIAYQEGASFIDQIGSNQAWEDKVTQGRGEAYGLEILLRKDIGKTTGWLSYTLAWNNRQFDNINGGKVFPFRYDRRHDVALVVLHNFSARIRGSISWIFATSNAFTLPKYAYTRPLIEPNSGELQGFSTVVEYGERNANRLNNMHRLDISIDFIKQKKKYERKWSIGLYNAYSRANPFYIDFQKNFVGDPNLLVQQQFRVSAVSLIPIIPSVSYNFKF